MRGGVGVSILSDTVPQTLSPMPGFKTFEEIKAWQAGRALTQAVYRMTSTGRFERDFALRDQIRRAAISITSNIAEGFERDRRTEFAQFLRYAKGSAGEVRSQLYVALDEGYIEEDTFAQLRRDAESTIRLIQGLKRHVGRSIRQEP
jgi:four helix bundle protein